MKRQFSRSARVTELVGIVVLSIVVLLGTALANPPSKSAGTDGIYVAADNNYRITVKFEPKKLVVVEPNKTSTYVQRGDSPVYEFTNDKNGITYLLEVVPGGDALKAYKPNTPENATLLKLLSATPSASVSATPVTCKDVLEIPVQNEAAVNPNRERLWGARQIPGGTAAGTYIVKGEPDGPRTQLRPDGTGVFEMYGAKPENVYEIRWWIQVNCDGSHIKDDHPKAEVYRLIVEYTNKPYQQQRFQRYGLVLQKGDDGEMFILDRVKSKR